MTLKSINSSASALIPVEKGVEDPYLGRFLYAQRRMGVDTQSYSSRSGYTEVPATYQPKSQTIFFQIFGIKVQKKQVQVVLANPSTDLLKHYVQDETVTFCVHPSTLENPQEEAFVTALQKLPLAERVTVMTTASSRTVAVIDYSLTLHALKCHLPFKISTFRRDLRPSVVSNSVAISRILDQTDIPHLPESIGITMGTDEQSGCGFIVRELKPRPAVQGTRTLVPCFALYGRDVKRPSEPPLIVKLILRDQEDPKTYVLKHVMFPIITDFAKAFTTQGILLEAHGQNALMEFDEYLKPKRIVHTDLDEYVDGNLRKKLGLSLEGLSSSHVYGAPTKEEPHGSIPSLIYDSSIGSCHFDPLAKVMHEYFGVARECLQKACQAKFQELMPLHHRFFTNTLYTYGYKTPIVKDVSYPLVPWSVGGTKPEWRPKVGFIRSRL